MDIPYTTNRIRYLHDKAASLIAEVDALRADLRHNLGLGKHDGATVYKVKRVKVKSHTRRGYTAVRCR